MRKIPTILDSDQKNQSQKTIVDPGTELKIVPPPGDGLAGDISPLNMSQTRFENDQIPSVVRVGDDLNQEYDNIDNQLEVQPVPGST